MSVRMKRQRPVKKRKRFMTASSSHRDEDAYWNQRADLYEDDDLWGWYFPKQDDVLANITKALDNSLITEKSKWL